MAYFEHAQKLSDLYLLRAAMIDGNIGNITLVAWVPIEKKVFIFGKLQAGDLNIFFSM